MGEGAWKDAETLRNLYHGERLTAAEVGERLGCHKGTVVYWMEKHGIERRDQVDEYRRSRRQNPARFETHETGYERWVTQIDGVKKTVPVHRLLAVSESGVGEVSGNVVHHKNGIPWDNRPENIETMSHSDHSKMHNPEGVPVDERSWGSVR